MPHYSELTFSELPIGCIGCYISKYVSLNGKFASFIVSCKSDALADNPFHTMFAINDNHINDTTQKDAS